MTTTRIPLAEPTGVLGTIATVVSRKLLGRVPTPLGVYWHNRRVLGGYLAISTRSLRWRACDPDLKSLAHMAVASLLGCSWCLDLGYFRARNEHLDLAKAREVPRWRESDVFTPLERAVLDYAEAMSRTPPTVTDEQVARLLGRFGEPALVELTAYVSLANFYARTNVALGVESDGFAAACGLPPMAARSA